MSGRRSLILGAGGFLGRTLCEALRQSGQWFRGFGRGSAAWGLAEEQEWHCGDFLNTADLARAMEGCDSIYHLISTTLPATSNREPVWDGESNIVGTLKLLRTAHQMGIKRIVFISSGGTVYGDPKETPIPETAATDPVCAYGVSKLAIEKYLRVFQRQYGISYCVLRVSNPYGEYQRLEGAQGAVGVFLGRVLRGQPITVWGDGSVIRDYVYAGDVASALIKAMESDRSEGIYNIGSGKGHSLNQVIRIIEAATGRKARVSYQKARTVDVPVNVLNIRRAREELKWSPQKNLSEGIADVVAHHFGTPERVDQGR